MHQILPSKYDMTIKIVNSHQLWLSEQYPAKIKSDKPCHRLVDDSQSVDHIEKLLIVNNCRIGRIRLC